MSVLLAYGLYIIADVGVGLYKNGLYDFVDKSSEIMFLNVFLLADIVGLL
jgi:hypothetical protein